MLAVNNLSKSYKQLSLLGKRVLPVLDAVTLDIQPGETLGLVGESGCGKSTLIRCMAALEPFDSGDLTFEDQDITKLQGVGLKQLRQQVQLIFQDPYDSLNPRLRIENIIAEPLHHFEIGSKKERSELVRQVLHEVGLIPEHLDRYPSELSRGQCQRVNIARALVIRPRIILCDEIISALDVAVGTQILQLLVRLQEDYGYGYVFISHDLSRVMQVSHRIAVMHQGRVVETAPGQDFHLHARHAASRALIDAIPGMRLSPNNK
jgi:oligopeptide transport system ATP-binding protein